MEDVVIQRNPATWKDEEKKTPIMKLLKGMKILNQNYFCKSFGKILISQGAAFNCWQQIPLRQEPLFSYLAQEGLTDVKLQHVS